MLKRYKIDEIDELAKDLLDGKIVAFPTDTVFGLACIYDNEEAISRIKLAKGRDAHKPLPMMCSSLEMIEKVAITSVESKKIMIDHFPGALTIIFKKREEVPSFVTNGFDTIAIRVPRHDMILNLIEKIGKPLLVTSANISNEASIKEYQEVINKLGDRIDGIVEEDAKSETSSTIIDLTDGFKILRQGEITKAALEESLKK